MLQLIQKTRIGDEMNNELYHYNHNHDALGRFARSTGGVVTSLGSKGSSKAKSIAKGISDKRKAKKNSSTIENVKVRGSKSNNTKLSKDQKKKLIEKGTAKEISQHKNSLSNRELETAIHRLQKEKAARMNLEKKLSELNSVEGQAKRQSGMERLDQTMKTVKNINEYAKTGIDSWNTIAKIHNSLYDNKWPQITGQKEQTVSPSIQKMIRRGDAEEIYKNRQNMNWKEINEAANRLKKEESIRDSVRNQRKWIDSEKERMEAETKAAEAAKEESNAAEPKKKKKNKS